MPGILCVFANATRVFAAIFRALTASVTVVPLKLAKISGGGEQTSRQ